MAANTGPGPLRKIVLNSDRKSDEEVVSPGGEGRASSERDPSEEPMAIRRHLSTDLKKKKKGNKKTLRGSSASVWIDKGDLDTACFWKANRNGVEGFHLVAAAWGSVGPVHGEYCHGHEKADLSTVRIVGHLMAGRFAKLC